MIVFTSDLGTAAGRGQLWTSVGAPLGKYRRVSRAEIGSVGMLVVAVSEWAADSIESDFMDDLHDTVSIFTLDDWQSGKMAITSN